MKLSISKHCAATAAIAATFAWFVADPIRLSAQTAAAKTAAPAATPRAADGHPDLSGVWWGGADVGGNRPGGGRGGAPGAGGRGGARGPAPVTFQSLYQPWAQAKAKTLADKDDPALGCTPTAFGTLNVSMYDVGAVAQIIQIPKFVVLLTETYHGFQMIPFDGRPHRDNVPPSFRGDAIGRWDGDTFVVDKTNFTDTNWMSAEGRVSFHSDALHVVERYTRVNANTLEIEATVEDPKVLTGPWKVPKQTLVLAPFDQILELACAGAESEAVMDAAAKQNAAKK